jgi:hypothetical protein
MEMKLFTIEPQEHPTHIAFSLFGIFVRFSGICGRVENPEVDDDGSDRRELRTASSHLLVLICFLMRVAAGDLLFNSFR